MIVLMQESGFCAGAKHAMNRALKHENEIGGRQIVLFGNLVNNKHVMHNFTEKGFVVEDNVNSIPENSVVIIRAHGIPKAVYDELKTKEIFIEDCTCIKIQKIHDIVSQKSLDGYKIIVIGKRKHPEVIGTVGWCVSSSVSIIENESELYDLDLSGKVCVVAQTTYNRDLWEQIIEKILKINPTSEIFDTLCNVTKKREDKAKEIAQTVNVMVVIGDSNSSNTCELYRQCSLNCKNTMLFSCLSDLLNNPKELSKILSSARIGLVGSASASDEKIAEIYNYLVFMDFMKSTKQEIEDFSMSYLMKYSVDVEDSPFIHSALNDLCIQNKGGKHIRGALIKLGELIASQGMRNNYLPIAAGYEVFQTSILIHDDIIDKSNKRRGKETIHIKSTKEFQKLYKDLSEAEHFGISRALCIGDYGFFISYQMLAKCSVDASVLVKLYQMYSQIFTITCEGEIIDTVLPYAQISAIDNYAKYEAMVKKMYEYKTAWYTLAGPLMLGAICGGSNEELISLLKDIAIPLGIAFQIKDDLLGIYSSEEVLGKSVLSDIRENKQTLLLGVAYKNADKRQNMLLHQHYGKPDADVNDLEIVKTLFVETGAKLYAEKEIQRLTNVGKEKISKIEKEYQPILYGMISYLVDRFY